VDDSLEVQHRGSGLMRARHARLIREGIVAGRREALMGTSIDGLEKLIVGRAFYPFANDLFTSALSHGYFRELDRIRLARIKLRRRGK